MTPSPDHDEFEIDRIAELERENSELTIEFNTLCGRLEDIDLALFAAGDFDERATLALGVKALAIERDRWRGLFWAVAAIAIAAIGAVLVILEGGAR